jgi:hypothetical protein
MTALQIVIGVVWILILVGVSYLIFDSYRKGKDTVSLALVPILSALIALFVVYAAAVFNIDIEQVKDVFNNNDEGTTTTSE